MLGRVTLNRIGAHPDKDGNVITIDMAAHVIDNFKEAKESFFTLKDGKQAPIRRMFIDGDELIGEFEII